MPRELAAAALAAERHCSSFSGPKTRPVCLRSASAAPTLGEPGTDLARMVLMKTAQKPTTSSRTTMRRPAKPRRVREHLTDRPPPEAAVLRDRSAPHAPALEGPVGDDEIAERMGEDSVMGITTGEDESEVERGDGDAHEIAKRIEEGSLFHGLPGDDVEDLDP